MVCVEENKTWQPCQFHQSFKCFGSLASMALQKMGGAKSSLKMMLRSTAFMVTGIRVNAKMACLAQ